MYLVSRVNGGSTLFNSGRVSNSAGVRVLRNSVGTASRVAGIFGYLGASPSFNCRAAWQEDRRVAGDFFVAASCPSARLVRVARSGILHLVSGSDINVQGVGAAFSSYDYRRCVVIMISGVRGGLLRLYQFRLSVSGHCATVQSVAFSRHFRFQRIHGPIVSGRSLAITTRLGVSNVHCRFFVGDVRFNLGQVTIK